MRYYTRSNYWAANEDYPCPVRDVSNSSDESCKLLVWDMGMRKGELQVTYVSWQDIYLQLICSKINMKREVKTGCKKKKAKYIYKGLTASLKVIRLINNTFFLGFIGYVCKYIGSQNYFTDFTMRPVHILQSLINQRTGEIDEDFTKCIKQWRQCGRKEHQKVCSWNELKYIGGDSLLIRRQCSVGLEPTEE